MAHPHPRRQGPLSPIYHPRQRIRIRAHTPELVSASARVEPLTETPAQASVQTEKPPQHRELESGFAIPARRRVQSIGQNVFAILAISYLMVVSAAGVFLAEGGYNGVDVPRGDGPLWAYKVGVVAFYLWSYVYPLAAAVAAWIGRWRRIASACLGLLAVGAIVTMAATGSLTPFVWHSAS
ncbi:hypothetical protein [Salininema proteolyticum]|uniref:DNA translocase FtsK 4TM region domain-containing protein n=1 Tax=Salininema proteolyticum TaxID=1607685 RepID=A0ABV8U0U5_9ACTN